MPEKISSRRNPLVQAYRRTLAGKDPARIVIEGPRLLEEALRAGLVLESLLHVLPSSVPRGTLEQLERAGVPRVEVTREVLAAISDAQTPQGCAGLARAPRFEEEALFPPGRPALIAVAAGVQNAGNLGAIARCAEAFGATGLIALEGAARLHRPSTLRGAMGSLYRLPALEAFTPEKLLALCRRRHLTLYACERGGATALEEPGYEHPLAVVFGAEAHGLPDALRAGADVRLSIPMEPTVESLGVAPAAAVVLHAIYLRRKAQHIDE